MSSASPLDLASTSPSTIARAELRRGERLIWADRAVSRKPGLASLKVVGFGLLFAGFGALWSFIASAGTAHAEGPWRFFPLFGLIFVVIGLAIATAPLWLRLTSGATVYGLTDQRVFMVAGRRSRTVRSTPFEKIGQLIVTEEPDGTGNILFSGVAVSEPGERGFLVGGLYGIPGVRRVQALIEREDRRRNEAGDRQADTAPDPVG
jgi:hypothetical protein